jgi:hypothetical protein
MVDNNGPTILPTSSSAAISFNEPTTVLSTVIPWFCLQPWYVCANTLAPAIIGNLTDPPLDISTTDTSGTTAWLAGGDDFQYLFPIPPAIYFVAPEHKSKEQSPGIYKGGDFTA